MILLVGLLLQPGPGAALGEGPATDDHLPMVVDPPVMDGGGLVPLADAGLSLESLEIVLRPMETLNGYSRARASYRVANPGPARTIRFGVPVYWPEGSFELPGFTEGLFREVRIAVNGRRVACQKSGTPVPGTTVHLGWCLADLALPGGTSELLLEHPAVGGPGISYPLWPAGAWKGPVKRLTIRIERVEGLEQGLVVSPPGVRRERGSLRWDLRDVDLRELGEVRVVGPSEELAKRLRGWERAGARLQARSSSALPPEGRHTFAAGNAIDSSPGTAWCEGAEGDGRGQWLEVTLAAEERPGWRCEILDALVRPGHALGQATYEANGRVRVARIESCSSPGHGAEVRLIKVAGDPGWDPAVSSPWRAGRRSDNDYSREGAAVWVQPPPGTFGGEQACLRLVIVDPIPGARFHDTCVSEFLPRLYCRPVDPGRPGPP